MQGLQQQLAAFATPPSGNSRAALEQQVSALQEELSRAVSGLSEAQSPALGLHSLLLVTNCVLKTAVHGMVCSLPHAGCPA